MSIKQWDIKQWDRYFETSYLSRCFIGSGNLLQQYKARQFIGVIRSAEVMVEFNIELYFALVEKMTVFDGGKVVVWLLDGTELECEI